MKIIIEVPDECAEKAQEMVSRFRRGSLSPSGQTVAIGTPGIGNPVSDVWFASRVLSVKIHKRGGE